MTYFTQPKYMEIYTNRHLRKSTFTLNPTKNSPSTLDFTSISTPFCLKNAFIYISKLPLFLKSYRKIKKIKIFSSKKYISEKKIKIILKIDEP